MQQQDPPQYVPGTLYRAEDKVTNNGKTYQVKPRPNSGWASQSPAAYAPGTGYAWTDAWDEIR
jgi:hypothetical protein